MAHTPESQISFVISLMKFALVRLRDFIFKSLRDGFPRFTVLGPIHSAPVLVYQYILQEADCLLQPLPAGHEAVLVLDADGVVIACHAQLGDDVPPVLLAMGEYRKRDAYS